MEVLLRAVDAVVGEVRLAGDHHDPPRKPGLPHRLDGVGPRRPRAQHHERPPVGPVAPGHLGDAALLGLLRQADDHLAVLHARLEARQAVHAGRLKLAAGGDLEAGVVPRADEAVAAEDALGQRRAVVGAVGVEGVVGAADAGQQDVRLAGLDLLHLAVLEVVGAGYGVLGHGNVSGLMFRVWGFSDLNGAALIGR